MKIENIKCPSCGAPLTVSSKSTIFYCPYCNSQFRIDEQTHNLKIVNANSIGYEFEKGRLQARKDSHRKKGKIILVLLITFILLLYFNNNKIIKYFQTFDLQNISENTIEITKKNLHPFIYSNDNTYVKIGNCSYTQDASDIIIQLEAQNTTKQIITVSFSDIVVDDVNLSMTPGNSSEFEVSEYAYNSNFYISLDDLQKTGTSNFSTISCKITVQTKSGEYLAQQNLLFYREIFDLQNTSVKNMDTPEIEQVTTSGNTIEITKKNLHPFIYSYDQTYVKIGNCSYTPGASDIVIELEVQNTTKQVITVTFSDIMVDDVNFLMPTGNSSEFEVSEYVYGSNFYISLDDLQKTGKLNFNTISCKITVQTKSGEYISQQKLLFYREIFAM